MNPSAGDQKRFVREIQVPWPSKPSLALIKAELTFIFAKPKSMTSAEDAGQHHEISWRSVIPGKAMDNYLSTLLCILLSFCSDIDNLAKFVLDSMNGLAYKDNAQVVELVCRKFYGQEDKTVVALYEFDI